ncbi:MAG: serine hydroxymethyltransferase, partial [Kangiellaceae bacterium]
GPLMHIIAGKAVAFKEALGDEFKETQKQVLINSKAMVSVFKQRGYKIVSDGTDNHLFLIDLIDKDITGKSAEAALGEAYITVNKNTVPNEPRSPFVTSGLRMGTPAITTRGMKETEATELTGWICDILDDIDNATVIEETKQKVLELTARFPVYQ